jgi:hypothetical protein
MITRTVKVKIISFEGGKDGIELKGWTQKTDDEGKQKNDQYMIFGLGKGAPIPEIGSELEVTYKYEIPLASNQNYEDHMGR